jgi:hypothetical protein
MPRGIDALQDCECLELVSGVGDLGVVPHATEETEWFCAVKSWRRASGLGGVRRRSRRWTRRS